MDLVKFREDLNVDYKDVKEALVGIVESYSDLTIKGPTDAEGYAKAREVMKEAGKIRRNIDEKRKAHKADSLAIGKMIDEVAKELQGAINPLEDRLKAEVQAIDDHIEKENALKKAEAAWPERRGKLVDLNYKNGEEQSDAEIERLKLMSDADFLKICSDLQAEKLAAAEAENKRLRDEAAERDRIANENKRIEDAKEQARKDALQETVNREAKAEAEKAQQRAAEMENQVWPLREKRIREIFIAKEVSNPEPRLEKLKAMVVKMEEVEFEKYLVELVEHADATLAQRKAEMGDREKMAYWLGSLLKVEMPVLSSGSIYQSDLDDIVGKLADAERLFLRASVA
jgi:hypothetical protein